jgi:hypothetical protein
LTRILLVDDEPLITDSLSYSLRKEGFEVKAVGDGAVALQEAQEYQPDLVSGCHAAWHERAGSMPAPRQEHPRLSCSPPRPELTGAGA